eukprot:m.19245 g.19245  ORF g.19245 m.19245 type:complete len:891 (+) comp7999_c1_seq1:98-2770(+)
MSSRIIIKSLPKKFKEERLRKLFAEHGEITQVQYFPNRRFAYIGYVDTESANAAVGYRNNTFLDTSMISVQPALSMTDKRLPRAWSKFSQGSSAHSAIEEKRQKVLKHLRKTPSEVAETAREKRGKEKAAKKAAKEKSLLAQLYGKQLEGKDKQEFEEFAEAMNPSGKSWANEVGVSSEGGDQGEKGKVNVVVEEVAGRRNGEKGDTVVRHHLQFEDSSDSEDDEPAAAKMASDSDHSDAEASAKGEDVDPDEPVQVFTVKLRGLPFKAKYDDIASFFPGIRLFDVRFVKNRRNRPIGVAFVDVTTEKEYKKALACNKKQLGKRYIEVMAASVQTLEPAKSTDQAPLKTYPNALKPEDEGIEESGRLFVRNLAYICTEDDLRALFEKFGPLSEMHMPIDEELKKPKGFAFVTYVIPEDAVKAYTALDASIFQGRLLHILPGRVRESESGLADDSTEFKKKKAAKAKANAQDAYNWNTLFMRQDAVADAVADELGVSKADLLAADSGSGMAVQLALAETKLVQENKDFLKRNGVVLSAFDTRVTGRSNTVILAKNLPYGSSEDEIRALFSKSGSIDRLVFPPSQTMALISFFEPTEARAAFRALAYRKYKGEPLYLEWAPENCFAARGEEPEQDAITQHKQASDVVEKTYELDSEGEEDVLDRAELEAESTTVFVKNLNFSTYDEALYNLFEGCGPIRTATIATKPNPHNRDELLSLGFGFVEFKDHKSAVKAVKQLQFAELEGHKLELKLSTRKGTTSSQRRVQGREGKKIVANSTKLVVRNVAFEATKKELRELFTPFGEIKSLRLPTKAFDGSHRGFAFIEFSTKAEAKKAFEALGTSTHLYGRRLSIEFAKDEGSVEALRRKTAKTAASQEGGALSKKIKRGKVVDL